MNERKITAADLDYYSIQLGVKQTTQLLQEVPQVYHTEVNDILLAALASALTAWAGSGKVTIGLEGHGREAIAKDIDLSRTVGWFTTLYPVRLEVRKQQGEEGNLIKSIK